MIDLVETEGGVIVPVRAQPKARRNAIVGTHAGRLRIAVTDPPEKGKANKSIAGILAAALEIAPSRVQLVAGATSRAEEIPGRGTFVTARSRIAEHVVAVRIVIARCRCFFPSVYSNEN